MKKTSRVLLLTLILLIPLFAVACGGDDPDTTTAPTGGYIGSGFEYRLTEDAKVGTYDCGYVSGGKAIYERSAPAREGFILLGLYNNEGKMIIDAEGNYLGGLVENETLTCRWVSEVCTLYLEIYGKDGRSLFVKEIELAYGAALPTLPTPTFEGYMPLEGWYYTEGKGASDDRVAGADGVPTAAFAKLTVEAFDAIPEIATKDRTVVYVTATLEYAPYTLTFDYNDGSGRRTTTTFLHHLDADRIEGPTACENNRDIYAWSTSKTELIPPTTLTGDTTLYAVWRPCRTVTIHKINGDIETTCHVTEDTPLRLYDLSAEAYDSGYTFIGWFTSPDFGGDMVLSTSTITIDKVADHYYPKANPRTYRLTFSSGGGTSCEGISFTVEDGRLSLPIPTKENYTFLGWREADGTATFLTYDCKVGNRTLYAVWQGEDRSFVYDGFIQQTVRYGSDYTIPPIHAPRGMVFDGWTDTSGTKLTDADGNSLAPCTETMAQTEILPTFINAYTLTVITERPDLTSVVGNATTTVGEGRDYVARIEWYVLNCGYDFVGFYDGDTLVSTELIYEGTMPNADLTLTARFAPKVFDVTVNKASADYCAADNTVQLTYDASFSLPPAYKQGYTFLGWETADGILMTDATGKSRLDYGFFHAVTLTPKFERSEHTELLIFDPVSLAAIKNAPNAAYILVCDIDMTGVSWAPFAFGGTLDGNGFAIKNLTVSTTGGNSGMFTSVSGTITDLTFKNLSVTSTAYEAVQIGGVCGHLSGTLSGVTVESGAVKNNGFGTTGTGLHGQIHGLTATLGGLVGLSDGTIKDCVSRVQVSSSTAPEGFAVGGIAGFIRNGWIENTSNYGSVESCTQYLGGIAGVCWYEATLRGLENHGDVTGTHYVGGVFGLLKHHFGEDYQVANLHNHGAVIGDAIVGGIVGEFNLYWEKRFTETFYITVFENTGDVTARAGSGVAAVGGIFGRVNSQSFYTDGALVLAMSSLDNSGKISSRGGTGVGGYIGHFLYTRSSCSFTASTQNGTVSGSGTTLDVGNEIGKSGN